jgi:hypothetical protein
LGASREHDGGGDHDRQTPAYVPEKLTTKVATTVTWKNTGASVHDVTTDASAVQNKRDISLPPGARTFGSRGGARAQNRIRWVNCYGIIDPISPFGGCSRDSNRELGLHAIDLYSTNETGLREAVEE